MVTIGGGEGDDHTSLDDTSLDTTDGDRTDTTNLVDILERKTERLVGGTVRGVNGIDGLEEGLARLEPALVSLVQPLNQGMLSSWSVID